MTTPRTYDFETATIYAFSHGAPESLPRLRLSDAMLPPNGDETLRPAGEDGREIIGFMNQLAICTADRNILIDGGPDGDAVQQGLHEIGLAPEEITDILITHGDHDHILGLVVPEGTPRYPKASYSVPETLWNAWEADRPESFYDPEQRAAARILAQQRPETLIRVVSGDEGVLDGIRSVPMPGHRAEHTVYCIDLGNAALYALGDLFIHPFFLEDLSRAFVHDADPDEANRSRCSFLTRLSEESEPLVLFSTHFPNHGLWQTCEMDGRIGWTPHL